MQSLRNYPGPVRPGIRQRSKSLAVALLLISVGAITTLTPTAAHATKTFTCSIATDANDNVTVTWTSADISRYHVRENGKYKSTVDGLSYEGTAGSSYQIVAWVPGGIKLTADCGDTPAPPPPPPVDDLLCQTDNNIKLSWNQIGQTGQKYQILADGKWKTSTTAVNYQGQAGVNYQIRAFLSGTNLTADCGDTPAPPPPPPVDDLLCKIDDHATLTWNQIGQTGQRYQVLSNGTWEASTNAVTYQGQAGVSYQIRAFLSGTKFTADCGSTTPPPPPTPPACIGLFGQTTIDEGNSSSYYLTLDKPATATTTFTISAVDGSARRIGNVDGKDRQDIMWGGYYTLNNIFGRVGTVYNRVPNGTSAAAGNRPMVGPIAVDWDYTLYLNGQAQNGSSATVTVQAGSTSSSRIEIRTWNEKITVDRASPDNHGYTEGTESFSLIVNGTHCRIDVSVNDRSSYNFVSPLVIDLNGDGITTSSIEGSTGVFDLLGNGEEIASGWTSDGFLVHDANANGVVDSGSELFGGGFGDGYAKLQNFDTNQDGSVDAHDDNFADLSVWVDANQDRVTDAGELITLADAGVVAISTSFVWDGNLDNGNLLGETGSVTMSDGRTAIMTDVYFATR